MPIPLDFLRGFLGALQIFFGYALGRAAARAHKARLPKAKLLTPALRVAVTGAAILWRAGWDVIAIVVFVLAAAALAAGAWQELRPPKNEDLTKIMFPEK